jgi:hypothetical protein
MTRPDELVATIRWDLCLAVWPQGLGSCRMKALAEISLPGRKTANRPRNAAADGKRTPIEGAHTQWYIPSPNHQKRQATIKPDCIERLHTHLRRAVAFLSWQRESCRVVTSVTALGGVTGTVSAPNGSRAVLKISGKTSASNGAKPKDISSALLVAIGVPNPETPSSKHPKEWPMAIRTMRQSMGRCLSNQLRDA